jgi:hypothetical protein
MQSCCGPNNNQCTAPNTRCGAAVGNMPRLCESCGTGGQQCCTGGIQPDSCGAGLTCAPGVTDAGGQGLGCQACGGDGQPCCGGNNGTCGTGLACANAPGGGLDVCMNCGATGAACCPGAVCQAGGRCIGAVGGVGGMCLACGGPTQVCCQGAVCNDPATECDGVGQAPTPQGTCAACGGVGQRCCGNGPVATQTCTGGLACTVQTGVARCGMAVVLDAATTD